MSRIFCILLTFAISGTASAQDAFPLHHPESLRRFEGLNRSLRDREEMIRIRPVEIQAYRNGRDTLLSFYDRQRIAPGPIELPFAARRLLPLLDGTRTRTALMRGLRRGDAQVLPDQAGTWLQALDEGCYLENRRYRERVLELVRDFREARVRPPICAGGVYDRDPARLRAWLSDQLDRAGTAAHGPVAGIIAPHIDYARGSAVYARIYGALKGRDPVARIVILGTAHMPSYRPFSLTLKPYETPLGLCPADTAFVDALKAGCSYPLFEDEFLHRGEHSIELQLPHLQVLFGGEVRIVAVLCGSLDPFLESGQDPLVDKPIREFRDALRAAIAASPGRTFVVAAADLAHMGRQFGDPFLMTEEVLRRVEEEDRRMLDPVVRGDADGFWRDIVRDRDARRICGSMPIYLMLKTLAPVRGTLLEYRQCTDPARTCTVTIPAVLFGAGEESIRPAVDP